MQRIPARPWSSALLALLLVAPAQADRLVTVDGRVLDVKKARVLPDGNYQLVFESGTITCAKSFVASVEIEGDMSDYVPQNEDEKKKLEQHFVKFRGKWMSFPAYQAELNKQAEVTKARTAELAAHAKFHDGWKKETKHFSLQSNTSPELLDYYADLLETYYDLMDQRVGIDPSPTLKKTKMKVSIYKNRPEFTQLTKMPPGVAGFFNYVEDTLNFYHDYQDPDISNWVALHEGTHLLTFLIEPQARPWIWVNEGIADYFGSATITRDKRGKISIKPGQVSLERLLTVQQAIAEGKCIPLEKLFTITRDNFESFEYAHAWSFIYFLNNAKPEYEKGFKKFFKDYYTIAKGVAFELDNSGGNKYGAWKEVSAAETRRVLLEKLGVKDTAKLEEEWKAYIASIPIDAPRARLKRGLNTMFTAEKRENMKSALDDIESALQAGVEDPEAYWARAMLGLMLGGKHDPVGDLRKAVELAPLEASYHSNLAETLCGMSVETRWLSVAEKDGNQTLHGDDDALGEAEQHFGLACELAPDNEDLRATRDAFLDLLQKKEAAKK